MTISPAPIGPRLDADVERAQGLTEWTRLHGSVPPYSTDRRWAMELLECLAIGADVTIRWEYYRAADDERWIVGTTGVNPDDPLPWEAEGQGRTLAEAICRNATHVDEGATNDDGD